MRSVIYRKKWNWRDGLDFASGEEAWYGGEPSGEATSEWRAGFATIPHALNYIDNFLSCLALRYEALVMRELNSVSDHQLHVSYEEWFTFAEHAL
ncbi:hypothetical protein Tco_0743068 [Tanacetum coccineum]